MRQIQINVEINMFGGEKPRKVFVYADANNPYEAACAAFQEMLKAFQENGYPLPSFGVSEHHKPIDFSNKE